MKELQGRTSNYWREDDEGLRSSLLRTNEEAVHRRKRQRPSTLPKKKSRPKRPRPSNLPRNRSRRKRRRPSTLPRKKSRRKRQKTFDPPEEAVKTKKTKVKALDHPCFEQIGSWIIQEWHRTNEEAVKAPFRTWMKKAKTKSRSVAPFQEGTGEVEQFK